TLHRTDERTQINNGLGWRHFTPTWMSGINFFFDRRRYEQRASGKYGAWMGLFSGFRRNDRLVKPLRYRKNHAGRG
ncbi:hypothetical protein CBL20_24855, partial [Shigella flexneri]